MDPAPTPTPHRVQSAGIACILSAALLLGSCAFGGGPHGLPATTLAPDASSARSSGGVATKALPARHHPSSLLHQVFKTTRKGGCHGDSVQPGTSTTELTFARLTNVSLCFGFFGLQADVSQQPPIEIVTPSGGHESLPTQLEPVAVIRFSQPAAVRSAPVDDLGRYSFKLTVPAEDSDPNGAPIVTSGHFTIVSPTQPVVAAEIASDQNTLTVQVAGERPESWTLISVFGPGDPSSGMPGQNQTFAWFADMPAMRANQRGDAVFRWSPPKDLTPGVYEIWIQGADPSCTEGTTPACPTIVAGQ
jgi:hypothetical protein